MKLQRLAITHLPGFPQGLVLDDFGTGLNVVTGPNASGKSSLIRALRYLIDPSAMTRGGPLMLQGEFVSGPNTWKVIRTDTQTVWEKNGRQADPPAVPGGDFLHCYWLAMDDLLEEGGTEKVIMERLRRELFGGFDLEAVRSDPLFDIGPRFGQKQEHVWRQKNQKLRRIIQDYESLDRERAGLPDLEQAVQEADEAATSAEKVKSALEWLRAGRELKAAEASLQTFPEDMELLKGDEIERLEELEKELDDLHDEQLEAQKKQDQAKADLEKTGLDEHPPTQADMEARRQDLNKALEHERKLTDLSERLVDARASEIVAAESLGVEGEHVPCLAPESVDRAVEIAEELRRKDRRVKELEEKIGVQPPDPDLKKAKETLVQELRRWLRQGDPSRLRWLIVAGISGLILTLAAAVTSGISSDFVTVLLCVAASISVGSIIWQVMGMRNIRMESERRVSEQTIEQPESWTVETVNARLQGLEEELSAVRLQEEKASHADHWRNELNSIRKEFEKLKQEKSDLAEEIGFDPYVSGERLARFLELARRLDEARMQCTKIEIQIEQEALGIRERKSRIIDFLQAHGISFENRPSDLATVKTFFQDLEQRRQDWKDAARVIHETEETLGALKDKEQKKQEALEKVYINAGLNTGERQILLERVQQHASYREEFEKWRNAVIREQERKSGLEQEAELVEMVHNDDEAGLKSLENQLREKARNSEELRSKRENLKLRLDRAGQDRALETARLEQEQALEALQDSFQKAMVAGAGHFLLDSTASEHRSEHEPRVLSAARERLVRYTQGRYVLTLDEYRGIIIQDRVQDILQGPAELSTGTRMQLLMALRLAWTAVLEEENEPLPVFLDEALTTTDPERFDKIAGNLKETADHEDRQIFYLSAQPADVMRWERVLGEPPHHVDLQSLRYHAQGLEPSQYVIEEPRSIPAPGDMSPEEYAALLGVPPVDPYAGAGAIHVFHILRDDLPFMYHLMDKWGITRIGQLQSLLESDAAIHAAGDKNLQQRLTGRCKTAYVWVDLWRQGRGLPVDRAILEQSGAVSGKFIEVVAELAQNLEGNARDLLEALSTGAVPNFRRNKVQELTEWLESQGYLSQEEMLSREERKRRAMQRLAGSAPTDDIQLVVESLEGQCRTD